MGQQVVDRVEKDRANKPFKGPKRPVAFYVEQRSRDQHLAVAMRQQGRYFYKKELITA